MARYFQPGDRVQLKHGGPEMEVVKYACEPSFYTGLSVSSDYAVCAWHDRDTGERKEDIVHQRNLAKVKPKKPFLPSYYKEGYDDFEQRAYFSKE